MEEKVIGKCILFGVNGMERRDVMSENGGRKMYGIAVDVGTTTLAMQLVDMDTKEICATYSALNSQRFYGADVLRRINAANRGKADHLQEMVCEDIRKGIQKLLKDNGLGAWQLLKIVIACNTTMVHLLMHLSCETLGVYPFTPITLSRIEPDAEIHTSILPGISAYIGGDIVAGLMACDFDRTADRSLFLDLGTNGEMVIGNRYELICTSTAAGPAFEGGNISAGTGGIAGAICAVTISRIARNDLKCEIQTIGDEPPIGICGAGLVEAVSELLRANIIDETGCYIDSYFDEGYVLGTTSSGKAICLTQQDIREFQMAKAAIRAGLELLIARYDIPYHEIKHVYLAGGLGQYINIEKAVQVGLFPKELQGRISAVGNTSLRGAYLDITEPEAKAREEALIAVAKDFPLALDDDFNELYMKYMYFE